MLLKNIIYTFKKSKLIYFAVADTASPFLELDFNYLFVKFLYNPRN